MPAGMAVTEYGAAITGADVAIAEFKGEAFNAWMPQQTWYSWCSTTGTTVSMADPAWQAWNVSVTTTTGSLAFNYTTNSTYVHNGNIWVQWNVQHTAETEEEQAAREARDAEIRAQFEERRVQQAREAAARRLEQEAANKRAQELLLSLLSPEQRATYEEHGWFEVRGSKGGRWRIRNNGQSGNVDLMPEIGEERDATFCAHPPGSLPNADAHLAQMLTLVTDEDSFRRTANVHYRRSGWTERVAA